MRGFFLSLVFFGYFEKTLTGQDDFDRMVKCYNRQEWRSTQLFSILMEM